MWIGFSVKMDGEEHAAMAKIAADSAVDTVFSSMMTKLDTQIASPAPGGPGSPGLGDEDGGAYRPDAQREDFAVDSCRARAAVRTSGSRRGRRAGRRAGLSEGVQEQGREVLADDSAAAPRATARGAAEAKGGRRAARQHGGKSGRWGG